MKKQLLTLTLALTCFIGVSQTFIHHSADDNVFLNVTPVAAATYTASVANPDTVNPAANPNTSTNVSSILSGAVNNNFLIHLPEPYFVGDAFDFKFRFYSENSGSNGNGSGRIIVRMFNSTLGTGASNRINLSNTDKVGGEWEEYTYSEAALPDNANGTIDANGGFDTILFIPANGAVTIETLYFDDIELNIDNTPTSLPSEATLDAGNAWYHNYSPDTFDVTINEVLGGVFLEQAAAVATPTTTGNSSPLVAKFTKAEEVHSQVKFQLPAVITTANQSAAIFKIRAYIPSTNTAPTVGSRLRLFLRDGIETTGQRNVTIDVTVFDQWQEYTFDFTGANLTAASYSTVNLLFDQPDTDLLSTGNEYFLDAFQGPSGTTLTTNDFELNNASIVAYPNPVINSFQLAASNVNNIESVTLYSITGKLLKTFNEEVNYDISDLATGVYIANIKTQSGSKALRIVKE
ncbi:T9SS type A sorting domain-containing protein [Lacinutrix sp. C3R15]|uniref:T9SS type A sorting domain-containing protein n=1 Tax=Flavobacteriaceae TaxID=49546 RepID=UPI001C086038|nr:MULTISPECIES: T9SS type A sorting domain-containing protein [Flavobacteriaceae]MBU2939820.1 T9SS type A sorting domain-containing protein [Lacinutrix sp. C3R15]MDO6623136.1 T9SS type A sorting domain-containing protein [Oceanihabitans sp. 1_MG-2023]